MLKHLAVIMDGNGRWATNSGKPRKEGHRVGAKRVRDITHFCMRANIPYLTLYAFSTENWDRPKIEVDFLMRLLEKHLKDESHVYIKNEIRFDFIGDVSVFSSGLQQRLFTLRDDTRSHEKLTQILALNYGSHDEISRTFIKLLNQNVSKSADKRYIKNLIEQNLDTRDYPPVDVLIRTGGQYRLSNFLLWQVSYAELFFTNTLWPDFSEEELECIILEFYNRDRKFGSISR